jgi:putative hydrolase
VKAEAAAAVLAEIAYLLRHQEGQAHRARAFTRAAAGVLRQQPDLPALRSQGRLTDLDGVGAGIERVLVELVDTGRSTYVERLRAEVEVPPVPATVTGSLASEGYRGDLHTHTDWSDGHATVLEMALAARARGYEYLAITDHSPRITVVNGLGPERLAAQRKQIDEANLQVSGLTILQGIEVDILEDGSLDLPDEALEALDVVVASPHVKLRQEPAAMTERMLRAVESPHVDVIGHPTGRRPGSRPGAVYDFELVFKRAAESGTALEIDCDPARMDLSPELAAMALAAGCRLSLDSDAHAPDQLVYVDLGLWMAQRAGVDREKLLNWMPLAELRTIFK